MEWLEERKEEQEKEAQFKNEFDKTKKLAEISLLKEYLKEDLSYEELLNEFPKINLLYDNW